MWIRHKIIMKEPVASNNHVSFQNDHDRYVDMETVIIPRDMWDQMGRPDTITMTIEPGDKIAEAGNIGVTAVDDSRIG